MSNSSETYVILLSMKPDKQFTKDVIGRHIRHLEQLDDTGKLVLCGPFLDHAGGMVVVRASSKEEARAIAEADPFVAEGFESYAIRTLHEATRENGYLAN